MTLYLSRLISELIMFPSVSRSREENLYIENYYLTKNTHTTLRLEFVVDMIQIIIYPT